MEPPTRFSIVRIADKKSSCIIAPAVRTILQKEHDFSRGLLPLLIDVVPAVFIFIFDYQTVLTEITVSISFSRIRRFPFCKQTIELAIIRFIQLLQYIFFHNMIFLTAYFFYPVFYPSAHNIYVR